MLEKGLLLYVKLFVAKKKYLLKHWMTITDYINLNSILFYSILTDTRCFKKQQKET